MLNYTNAMYAMLGSRPDVLGEAIGTPEKITPAIMFVPGYDLFKTENIGGIVVFSAEDHIDRDHSHYELLLQLSDVEQPAEIPVSCFDVRSSADKRVLFPDMYSLPRNMRAVEALAEMTAVIGEPFTEISAGGWVDYREQNYMLNGLEMIRLADELIQILIDAGVDNSVVAEDRVVELMVKAYGVFIEGIKGALLCLYQKLLSKRQLSCLNKKRGLV